MTKYYIYVNIIINVKLTIHENTALMKGLGMKRNSHSQTLSHLNSHQCREQPSVTRSSKPPLPLSSPPTPESSPYPKSHDGQWLDGGQGQPERLCVFSRGQRVLN